MIQWLKEVFKTDKCKGCPKLVRGRLVKISQDLDFNKSIPIGRDTLVYAWVEPVVSEPWQYFPEDDPGNIYNMLVIQCIFEYGVDVITALEIPEFLGKMCLPSWIAKGDLVLATKNSVYVFRRH